MHTAAILGYFLAFGLMGLWHGIEPRYIAYGLYMAALLSGIHMFSNWNKMHHYRREGVLWNVLAVFITFNAVCFGLLTFSARIGTAHVGAKAASSLPPAACRTLRAFSRHPEPIVSVGAPPRSPPPNPQTRYFPSTCFNFERHPENSLNIYTEGNLTGPFENRDPVEAFSREFGKISPVIPQVSVAARRPTLGHHQHEISYFQAPFNNARIDRAAVLNSVFKEQCD